MSAKPDIADRMLTLAVEPTAEELAHWAKCYDIDVTGLATSELARAVSRRRITQLAAEMMAEADALYPSTDIQNKADAQLVLAHNAKFAEAFERGNFEAALAHFAEMSGAAARLGRRSTAFAILAHRKLRRRHQMRTISQRDRGRKERQQKACERYRQEWTKGPHHPLSDKQAKQLDATIRADLCIELGISRSTLNDYLKDFDPTT